MRRIIYPTLDQAVEIHKKTVEVSGGGADGLMDIGLLDSVLEHIQNDVYYSTFEEKLTHLFYSANKFHCFQDGNKRIAISLGAQFLLLNGYLFIAGSFIREMENISYHVAAGRIDKDLLLEIITALINGKFDSEEIKLKILHAIQK
ncbi:MAG: type II toxin-antitoxin system death-on-curing family toxin [Candidatus Electryonea clarkiae]|nr:type II toxin-antitoxin system death-on-curing family toxin [Candidatus Electryonea clarkiae]MDP8285625.1 type II toxin-antitoxin system death-on-curing family toxin [Candidatus Electryonea clarkiae]